MSRASLGSLVVCLSQALLACGDSDAPPRGAEPTAERLVDVPPPALEPAMPAVAADGDGLPPDETERSAADAEAKLEPEAIDDSRRDEVDVDEVEAADVDEVEAADVDEVEAVDVDEATDAMAGGEPEGELSFESDVHPFLARLCSPCHATDRIAGHNVGSPNVAVAYDDAIRLGFRLVQRARSGMPPRPFCLGGLGSPGCLTVEQLALLEAWFEQGSPP